MRIHQLAQSIIKQFVPIEPQTEQELNGEAAHAYGKLRDELNTIQAANEKAIKTAKEGEEPILKPLELKHKIMRFLEVWYVRYFFAIAFIFLVPAIKNFIKNFGEGSAEGEETEDDFFNEYMNFKRMKKQMNA